MVDEYQDTNALQASIVRRLAAEHDNVMAVGDDAQSIYAFRGASFRNIMDFPNLFAGTRIIKLEQNYRSTQAILDLANAVISQARESYTKVLFTTTPGGETPMVIAAYDENFQSRFVSQRVLELREEGVPLADIAILFRASFHSFDLEIELSRHDIPFVKRGGFKFIETAHIKDVLAHLRLVANPRDAVSWNRILLLVEGIGPRNAERIIARLVGADDMVACLEDFPGRSFTQDLRALAGLFRRLLAGPVDPAGQFSEVVRYYQPILERVYRDDYPRRQRDLDHFGAIAGRYRRLEALLSDVALEPPTDSADNALATSDEEGRLTLSTVHSAKGLEWHTVFVIWAADGRFPSAYSMESDDELEEERRLMYVAMTRAKRNLYLSYPLTMYDRVGGRLSSQPSHFLENIPREVLRPVRLVEDTEEG
jgi:DNA helicase-2/ATP-dependent DNA helicase PcrA